jgi:nitrite reductase/ring-hydroxylating ferredoxin subunit
MESVNCLLIPLLDLEKNAAKVISVIVDKNNKNMDLIIVRTVSQFYVYLNQCPHQGRRLDYAPGQFLTQSDEIICAAHGAIFDLFNGICVQGPCRGDSLVKLPADIHDGQLRIDISQIDRVRT